MSFSPVYNDQSRILILGTYPSPKSREQGFYYGHPQNRFWKLLSLLLDCPTPETIPQKKQMLLSHHIAIWDVCDSCEIDGASDSTIRAVVPNDIRALVRDSNITAIYCNGAKAYELFLRHCGEIPGIAGITGITVYKLPSTSPANAAFSLKRLAESWKVILSQI